MANLPGRPFARLAQAQQNWRAANPGGFAERLGGLLAGGNPMFDIGVGLLAASGPSTTPVSTGQALAHAAQFASERQRASMTNQALREQLISLQQQRQQQSALADLIGSLSQPGEVTPADGVGPPMTTAPQLNPQQARILQMMAAQSPEAALQILAQRGGLLADEQSSIGASPIGKLFADLDTAESQGNTEAVDALRAAIQRELGSETKFSEVRGVRNDVIRSSGEFLEAQRGLERVQVGAQAQSAAGDLALIFGFMKTLDPTSVVREGEQASAANAAGVPERIRGIYNRILTGERLTPEQRQDFVSQAQAQFRKVAEQQQKIVDDARGFAERNNLPAEDVVPAFVLPQIPDVTQPPQRDTFTVPGFPDYQIRIRESR